MGVPAYVLDGILVGIVLEGAVLAAWLMRRRKTEAVMPLLLFLGSGAFMIIALRMLSPAILEGRTAGLLFASGLLHALCLWRAFKVFMGPPHS